MRIRTLRLVGLSVLVALLLSSLAACAPAEPQVVERVVKETVVVEKEVPVEKQVEVVVTATPEMKPEEKKTLIMAQSSDMNTLDPHRMQATVERAIWITIYSGLTRFDATMSDPQPEMAKSWENPDDTTFIFHLREDATWHSGRPFTADDVVWNFDRIVEVAGAGRIAGYMSDVESVEAIDQHTVQFNLKQPSAVFMMYTPYFVFVDKETEDQIRTNPIGSGPYKFKEWIPNDHITLVRNEDFWDNDLIRRPDELIIKPISEEGTRLAALQTGEIDISGWISPKLLSQIAGSPGVTSYTPEVSASYRVVLMNVTQPPFDNVKLRQAVAAAIDREAIWSGVWFGLGEPSCNPLPSTSWAYNPAQECGPRDVERARQLVAESGIPTPINVEMKVWSDDFEPKVAQIVQSNLAEIGINVEISVDDFAFWLEDVWINKNFQIATTGYTREADPDGLMSSVFRKGQGNNPMGYHNPRVEELFDLGKAVYDIEERAKYYQEIIDIVLDEVPIVKTITHVPIWAAGDNVGGLELLPVGVPNYPNIYVK